MSVARNVTYQMVFEKLYEFFQYDKDKALSFYLRPIEKLDNESPYEMIKNGKGRKLLRYINALIN